MTGKGILVYLTRIWCTYLVRTILVLKQNTILCPQILFSARYTYSNGVRSSNIIFHPNTELVSANQTEYRDLRLIISNLELGK